ncbi:hypothetical protein T310_7233 [Rasamsonia emersonii CBS 393.64]|uniref:Uncharacterized protein n=1 Tax=Rasamsonia emersonii (strain ATCC 16479 / CBS 393.64 / IMI 116815) TaxID=1408163 RepID=A0A0F4YMG7_RASE3|nr:hypothetical protein T310_7233 [Rasamsonia emersonii CBS 393.64]KKA18813.1 hypothetical protein T310_7233 [Rasamsonia emersonii CBS 393.64]
MTLSNTAMQDETKTPQGSNRASTRSRDQYTSIPRRTDWYDGMIYQRNIPDGSSFLTRAQFIHPIQLVTKILTLGVTLVGVASDLVVVVILTLESFYLLCVPARPLLHL